MNKRLITTAVTAGLFFAAVALPPTSVQGAACASSAGGKEKEKLKTALSQLNLTTAQKSKISSIVAAAKTEHQVAKTTAATTGTTTGTAHAANKGVISKIMAVLTSAQQTKLKSLMKGAK